MSGPPDNLSSTPRWLALAALACMFIGVALALLLTGRATLGVLASVAALATSGTMIILQRKALSLRSAGSSSLLAVATAIAAIVLLGWLVIAIYAGTLQNSAAALSIGLMVSVAAAAAGGFVGFIFGIPRYAASLEPRPESGPGSQIGSPYRANTNLEQISDWLTKILVGVGLVQLGSISESLSKLIMGIAGGLNPLGPTRADAAMSASVLVVYSVLGFIAGYVSARTMLLRLFRKADEVDLQTLLGTADLVVTSWLQGGGTVTEEEVRSAVRAVPTWYRAILAARAKWVHQQSTTLGVADEAARLVTILAEIGD